MISAILLAAGQSKRMGNKNKLAKKINNKPLIVHSVENILSSPIDELIIVVGYQKEIIEKLIKKDEKIKFIYNKDFETGVASSIKVGLNYMSEKAESFFICLADMPNVNKNIYNLLIKSKNNNEIIVPTYKGKKGNPVLFSISMKKKIMAVKGDAGAKKIIEMNEKKTFNLETNDLAVTLDFNIQENFYSK